MTCWVPIKGDENERKRKAFYSHTMNEYLLHNFNYSVCVYLELINRLYKQKFRFVVINWKKKLEVVHLSIK